MPNKMLIMNIIAISLQYTLVIFLYYFLAKAIKLIYKDLKAINTPLLATAEMPTRNQARLLVVDGEKLTLNGNIFPLGESLLIGRGEDNNIVINDSFVSHEHACIARHKQEYWLSDLNSTNRTYLNNQQITEEVLLKNGDMIKIGAVTFKFER